MGNIELAGRQFFGQKHIFADLFEHTFLADTTFDRELFRRTLRDEPSDLIVTQISRSGRLELVEHRRDLLKSAIIRLAENDPPGRVFFGIEFTTETRPDMVLNVLQKDTVWFTAQYDEILRKQPRNEAGEPICPEHLDLTGVVTIVVNLGKEPWNGPLQLSDVLDTALNGITRLKSQLYVVSLADLSDSVIHSFSTELQQVARVIRACRNRTLPEVLKSNPSYRDLDEMSFVFLTMLLNPGYRVRRGKQTSEM